MKHDLKVYLRLLSYLKPFWGLAVFVVIGFAINAATEVSVAKLLERIINAIQHRDQSFTSLFPLLVVMLMFAPNFKLFWQTITDPISWMILKGNLLPKAFS